MVGHIFALNSCFIAQRPVMQPDEQSSEVLRSSPTLTGEEEKVISVYEEAFKRIKEATGVTDIQVGGVDGGVIYFFYIYS